MVKLATAREIRLYGPWRARNKWEYINAGIYVFASVLLLGGYASQLSVHGSAMSGLVVLLIGLALVAVVNVHDFVAHAAGVDYRLGFAGLDAQLALVEFAVPVVQTLGSALAFLGVLLFLVQMEKGFDYKLERHALNMLIAGPALWVLGSIHNLCQIYERADGHVQMLQKSVQIPFLMGSLLFLVGGVFNRRGHFGPSHPRLKILEKSWVWLSMCGSLLFLVGGLLNVVKVFKMQQMDGVRLEKLRGGAQERLGREREGQVPLILEDERRRRQHREEAGPPPPTLTTTYKDALVGEA